MRESHVVLVVDDDPADLLMTRRALEECSVGSEVHVASGGAEAIEFLARCGGSGTETRVPHLALVDLNMPGADGRDVVRAIRSEPRFKSLPVIVLTTSADPKDVADLYDLGADAYVVKPSDFDELRDSLEAIQTYWFRVVELPPGA